MSERIRFGVIGTGRIVGQWMRDVSRLEDVEVAAIASMDLGRARAAAARYGIPRAYGSYQDMLAGEDCEAVYIATPHTGHHDCAVMALRAGRHVLCEKPLAVNAAQLRDMVACARDQRRLLMEGMWTRFFPATRAVREIVRSGRIGEVSMIQADFSFHTPFETQTRMFDPARAGGALLDVGCYGLQYAMDLYGAAPEQVSGTAVIGSSGVDEQDVMALRFPGGRVASVACGLRVSLPDTARIHGTAGSIEAPGFWHPTGYDLTAKGQTTHVDMPDDGPGGFAHEARHFCECIRAGLTESPVMPHADSLAAAEAMDAFRARIGLRYPFE